MDQINAFIAKNQSNFTADTELELRHGTFSGKFFNSSITIGEFIRIKHLMSKPIITGINDTNFYKFPYRQRKIDGESVWIKKDKIDHIDLPEINMRVALTTERCSSFKDLIQEYNIRNPKGFFAPQKVTLLRKKTRYSENFGSWRLDLTMVENYKFIDHRWALIDTVYECELELIDNDKPYNALEGLCAIIFQENNYYKLTKSTKFIGNQPKTLERKDLIKLTKSAYSLTDKVDGDRMFLLCGGVNGNKLIDKKMGMIDMIGTSGLEGTLLDGEYLSKTKQFLAFDILYYNGECVMNKILQERHTILDSVIKSINNPNIIAKTFYYSVKPSQDISFVIYSENIFKESLRLWESRGSVVLDGLIYTPLNETYNQKTNTYKWKDSITIDVLIRDMQFYAGDRGKMVRVADRIHFDHGFECNEEISDGEIGEFYFDNDSGIWKLLRLRKDKKFPNAILTVKSALTAIKQAITIQDLSEINGDNTGMQYNIAGKTNSRRNGESDIGYRKFHNLVKNNLVEYKSDSGSFLLDLGAGKGGDLMKWERAGYTHVLAIDSSWQHIFGPNGFHERYRNIKDKLNVKVTIIWGDVLKPIRNGEAGLNPEESKKLKMFFKEHKSLKFDKITCNFAVHYFMRTQELWSDYTRNVRLLLKKGGLFVGTYLDGNQICPGDYHGSNGDLIYTLKIVGDNGPPVFNGDIEEYWGNVPEISVKTMQWEHFIDEPVIFPKLMEQFMKKMKFKKEPVPETFEEYYNLLGVSLSEDEQKISFMHRVFIYKK